MEDGNGNGTDYLASIFKVLVIVAAVVGSFIVIGLILLRLL